MSVEPASKKTTIRTLQEKRRAGRPITMITAYDFPSAQAVEQAGIDSLLVGDSLGMVELGYASTVPVTMDEMIHHCKAVRRGAGRPYLIGDMPFLSYQADPAEAVRNAGRFFKEADMDAVKLEGGLPSVPAIRAISGAGMAVVGHIGLTPQSVAQLGGYRVQGRSLVEATRLLDEAQALEAAGAVMLVLEMVPAQVAAEITRRLTIPTIGIGAGAGCSGQVLVLHDLLGLFERFTPRFVKQYAHMFSEMKEALAAYRSDVDAGAFPSDEHSFPLDPATWNEWLSLLPHDELSAPSPRKG
jgi:3-methyl-2-oxobutanoate hydroxymethyltransferase